MLNNEYFKYAVYMVENELLDCNDPFLLAELLEDLYNYFEERNKISDNEIFYNDEIISITENCNEETIDIVVSDDNLFYANGILTHNSMG